MLGEGHAAIDARGHCFSQLRERAGTPAVARQRNLRIVQGMVPIEQRAESPQRRICRILVSRARELPPQILRGRFSRQLDLDQQDDAGAGWQRDLQLAVNAVFADDLNRPRVEVFDGGDVDAKRIARSPGFLRRGTELGDQPNAGGFVSRRNQRATRRGWPGRGAEQHLGDHAERAFGADEQVNQIHLGRNEISGRVLRNSRHPQRRDGDEACGTPLATFQVEDVAVDQDHGDAVDPLTDGAVLESGRTCRACGGRASSGRAEIGWYRRTPSAHGRPHTAGRPAGTRGRCTPSGRR